MNAGEDSSRMGRQRRSASAEAALRAEMERVGRMSVEERMKAALSMGRRFSWIRRDGKRS